MKKYLLLCYIVLSAIYNGFSQDSTESKTVIFICDHGAYKSVVAAAAFNKMAKEQGLNVHAIARGIAPAKEIAPNALNGLKQDSFSEITSTPQKLSNEELTKATYVVTFCSLPVGYHEPVPFEEWSKIPLINGYYPDFRDSVLPYVKLLINNLKSRP
jgi:arsenate reductase (thioredoxin)